MQYFVIKPGPEAHLWPEFYRDGVAKIGYRVQVGDMSRYQSRKEIDGKSDTIEAYHKTEVEILWKFYTAPENSIIFAGKGRDRIVGVGLITGGYRYVPESEDGYVHQRKVDWLGELNFTYSPRWGGKGRLMRTNAFGTIHNIVPVLEYIGANHPDLTQTLVEAGVPEAYFRENTTTKLTVAQWREILSKPGLTKTDDKAILRAFLNSPGHTNYTGVIDEVVFGKPSGQGAPGPINSKMAAFADRIVKQSGYPINIELRDDGKTYSWPLAFDGSHDEQQQFLWTLRPALAEAMREFSDDPTMNGSPTNKHRDASPKNQILYGPPGTGKTYRTISLAVQIANPEFDVTRADREAVRAEYQRLQAAGRIVFTTFHQSLAYEDFVEGLKPKLTNEDCTEGDVAYEIKPGIFRQLCQVAAASQETQQQLANGRLSHEEMVRHHQLFKRKWHAAFKEGKAVIFKTETGKPFQLVDIQKDQYRIKPLQGKAENEYFISIDGVRKVYEILPQLKLANNFQKKLTETYPEYLGYASYYNTLAKEVEKCALEANGSPQVSAEAGPPPNHILIIDEINRGNVSRIFGELITLLEPDKRLGAAEALTVTLPYSGEEFGVPPNLYVIGTMNTADRSVVALDSALRRRFSFVEVGPDPQLLKEVSNNGSISVNGTSFSLIDILKRINQRIEFLLDRDHCIGHSYFFKVTGWESLRDVMTNKVAPLLQEYFYDDYGRIRLILGGGFVACQRTLPRDLFPGSDALSGELDEQTTYQLQSITNEAELAGALEVLLNGRADG